VEQLPYTQIQIDHSARHFERDGLTVSGERRLDGYFVGADDTRLAASNRFLRLACRVSVFNSGGVDVSDDANSFQVGLSVDPGAP
jgi:hypothetical protein